MRLLLLTDIHGDHDKLEQMLEKEEFDGVLCAGDLSDAREFDDYEGKLGEVLDVFEDEAGLTKAIPGNMDPEEACVSELIHRRMNIHKRISAIGEVEVVGFGGGITPFGTPFEPEGSEVYDALSKLWGRMSSDRRVAVIHQPPKNTAVDELDGDHVGSEEVRALLEETEFDLVLTGHIHEAKGKDRIGDTVLVNPGPVLEGNYAVATLNEDITVELKQL